MSASKSKKYIPPIKEPKYPRVVTSGKRHVKLATAARKLGVDLQEYAESRFALADQVDRTK